MQIFWKCETSSSNRTYLTDWDLISALTSAFTAGVPIGANGCDTIGVVNPVDASLFATFCLSAVTKSVCMLLFAASPPKDVEILFELAETAALCDLERGFRGIW